MKIWLEKPLIFRGGLVVQVQQSGTGRKYGLEILHQCSKRVKAKSKKVMGTKSYVVPL